MSENIIPTVRPVTTRVRPFGPELQQMMEQAKAHQARIEAAAPQPPAPDMRPILESIDNEHDLRKHAQALAIADHAGMVDYERRRTEYAWHVEQAARIKPIPYITVSRIVEVTKEPTWWANVWTAAYADARDALNAGEVPRVELLDLDAEYEAEALLVAAGRGGCGPDEPDPWDIT